MQARFSASDQDLLEPAETVERRPTEAGVRDLEMAARFGFDGRSGRNSGVALRLLKGEEFEAEDGSGEGALELRGANGSDIEVTEYGVADREDASESSV